eukprot:CAMPEP_0173434792 /NCGR_PEP_ID=MMETSP1357-20121228/13464_1 /TAXON_ID=77926 /ORGANISM="Hemiselmis rufescens, Strain PCC563" /LENGTH=222 /DNA_ID=CAMNT_0014399695 /DNA_START=13 /DNA_END=681 /DNA_ORIENTATION=+
MRRALVGGVGLGFGAVALFLVLAMTPRRASVAMSEKMAQVHSLSEALAKQTTTALASATAPHNDEHKKALEANVPWAPSRESQRLDPNDPRSKPSVFAWLWKASDPMPVVHTNQLTGNGTTAVGNGGGNSTGAESVEQANKENQDAAKKDLALSQDKEMRFFALWTVSILLVLGVGLCSIKYARSILGGSSSPMGPPGQGQQRGPPQEGGYGAVGGGGYPPG